MKQKIWTKEAVLQRLSQAESLPASPPSSVSETLKERAGSDGSVTDSPATDSPVTDTIATIERAYRSAAAVLSWFSPADLKPAGDFASEEGASVATLLDDSIMLYRAANSNVHDTASDIIRGNVGGKSGGGQRWQLRDGPRKRALKQLGSRQAIQQALAANEPRPSDALQQIFERLINDNPLPLDEQSLEELTATERVIGWLEGIVEPLPPQAAVREMLTWAELLEPFRYLVGDHFRGRKAELETLQTFVMQPNDPTTSKGSTASRPVTRLFDPTLQPKEESHLLLVHGPGGMGKSTLLAKFLLDTIGNSRPPKMPFVYIDFDRPGILPEEPLTLLSEAVHQLGIQFPTLQSQANALHESWRDLLAMPQESPNLVITKGGSRGGATRSGISYEQRSVAQTIQERASYIEQFITFWQLVEAELQQVTVEDLRLLFLLDTFEEVQYLSQDFVDGLLNFAYDLVDRIPALRVIVSGRAPIEDRPTSGSRAFSRSIVAPSNAFRPMQESMQELVLGELDHDAAIGFLVAHGVPDEEVAQQIVEQVGGNPLSLHLAINLLFHKVGSGMDGAFDLIDPQNQHSAALQIDQGLIQGQLYTRILSHIHDDDVRQLAHPGLVLRRVTPELIKDVLAEPCKVDVPTIERARELFDELMSEVSLVRMASDGSLHHRPDVRRIMLSSLQRDEPLRVYAIHRRAVDYYAARDGLINRAEEIYHRLLGGSLFSTINERWMEGIEPYLRNAIEELPPNKQPYLASRLGITSAEFDWDQAGIEEWELYTEKRLIDLISLGQPERALELLAERSERTVESPLYRLEAQILADQGRWLEAQQVAKAGIYAASQAKDDEKLLDLLRVAANASEQLGEYTEALEMLDATEALDLELREPDATLHRLEIITQRLRLLRLDPDADRSGVDELKKTAYALYQKGWEVDVYPDLFRDLAVEIGLEYMDVLERALALVYESSLSEEQIALLTKMRQEQHSDIAEYWKLIQMVMPDVPLKNLSVAVD